MKKNVVGLIGEDGWIYCPICRNKTRVKVRKDTVLINFPLYCPKCRQESVISSTDNKVELVSEPDARRRASNL